MRTIALTAAKGGVGKSSLTAALAVAARRSNPDLRIAVSVRCSPCSEACGVRRCC
jgi:MinD-like ATPase involved in chromosome partitioning or flagellar assembly